MVALVFNPGSNSLKAGIVCCHPGQRSASEGTALVEVIVESIGKQPKLSVYQRKKISSSESIAGDSFEEAGAEILNWLDSNSTTHDPQWRMDEVDCICVRVVHGGWKFTQPVEITSDVEREIKALSRWAPLHNQRSIEILPPLKRRFPKATIYAVFDTAFHSTIPLKASLYAIPFELTQKHNIRRYGFHGISHRYLMERYASIVDRSPSKLNLVTMHLESGCSVTAIARGESVDNTMGLTPLEGLMMGTRSGDVDPSPAAYLVQEEQRELASVMEMLERE